MELTAFLHKREELHPILKKLVGCTDRQRQLARTDLTQNWLSFQASGVLVQRLIAPIDQRTRGRQKGEAGVVPAVKVIAPEEMSTHINTLHGNGFDSRTYQEKGYFLRGLIKTDGYTL